MATPFSMKKTKGPNFKCTEEELKFIDEQARTHKPPLNRTEYLRVCVGLEPNGNMRAREFISNPSAIEKLANIFGKEKEDGKKG